MELDINCSRCGEINIIKEAILEQNEIYNQECNYCEKIFYYTITSCNYTFSFHCDNKDA